MIKFSKFGNFKYNWFMAWKIALKRPYVKENNAFFLFSLVFSKLKGITDLFCQNQKSEDEFRYCTTENFHLITKDLMTAWVHILYFQWQRKCFVVSFFKKNANVCYALFIRILNLSLECFNERFFFWNFNFFLCSDYVCMYKFMYLL